MSNVVPSEEKTFSPRDQEWLNQNIKNLLRKQNKLYKKYRKNGYNNDDRTVLQKLEK